MARPLTGRVITITGASSGIGAATALACAARGMRMVLSARREDRLAEVAAKVAAMGAEAEVVACDVTRDDDVQRLIDRSVERFGRIDAMFANAGFGFSSPVDQTPMELGRELFEVNFWGTVRCIQAVAPVMREQGAGHILICSSAASEVGVPNYGFYAATKAAQDSLAGAMRAELADDGIDVTSVHPIGTKTQFGEVVDAKSPGDASSVPNTPGAMVQSADHVADTIVAALANPVPEVWPSVPTRLFLAAGTAWPRLAAWVNRRFIYDRQKRGGSALP